MEHAPIKFPAYQWTFFSKSGEILLTAGLDYNSARVTHELNPDFFDYVPGKYDADDYWIVETAPGVYAAARREEMSVTLGGAVLRNVPAGAEVCINTRSYVAVGGDLALNFKQPGEKEITIYSFPFKPWRATYATD